jgi:sarcosine oxidase
MSDYDVIVAGVGGMGSATCYQLARRGLSVLGLERFDIPHTMGSSHGINRIIRLAYFEDPSYVPLLRRAYELWRETERACGEQLLFVTGGLDIGRPGSRVLEGSLEACRIHDLPHQLLEAAELNRRFPGYALPDGYAGVFQAEGGFVASERAISAHVTLALAAGAEIRGREAILGYEPDDGGVIVTTDRDRYRARRVVLTTGAWIGQHVPQLATTAVPERQVLGWFAPKRPADYAPSAFPVSNALFDEGHVYQFPSWGVPGFKIGLYHHFKEEGSADALSREPRPEDEAALRAFVSRYFPGADGPVLSLRACLFTNTPDEHFVIDTLPGAPEVIVASPCSGHGFKFASVMGEILADLAERGETRHDISLFRLDRLTKA